MTVTVYTRSMCGACVGTKSALERLGVPFTEVNVEENLDIAQQLVDEGWRAMPVVKTDSAEWSGMNMTQIRALAEK